MTSAKPALIGIDWGTSRLRAMQIDAAGQVIEHRENDRGILSISDGNFESALGATVDGWPTGLPVLMCGMIGSRQGWREMPYCPCPARTADLSKAVGTIRTAHGLIRILGGVSITHERDSEGSGNARRQYDVMRGEETQIFGVEQRAGSLMVVTPGTHSKWAIVEDGAIKSFRTYMTGEVYAILRQHSILGRLMKTPQENVINESSFMEGVQTAFDDSDLLHSLFNVRTQALFQSQEPEMLPSYLSGILIGSEVSGAVRRHTVASAIIISSPELGSLYQRAMSAAGVRNIMQVDGADAVARGLWRLWQSRGEG